MEEGLCFCPKCGRTHRALNAGKPPASISGGMTKAEYQYLSRVFCQHAELNINHPGYRINEWLKQKIADAG